MLPAMSFLDRIRTLLAGPAHVQDDDAEDAAALHEEFGASEEDPADPRGLLESPGGGAGLSNVGFGASEAAEAAQDDLATEEAPPDPS